jgi:hypothetical protein
MSNLVIMKELKEIQKIILGYTDITKDILLHFQSAVLPRLHPVSVRLLFLKRFHYNSLTIYHLLEKYLLDRSFKLPLYLVLRACVSDFLILKYFDKIIRDNQTSQNIIEDSIKSYLVENLQYLHKELIRLKNSGAISNDEYNKNWSIVQKKYPEFIDKNSGKLIKSKSEKISAIAKILKADPNYYYDSKAYELYDQFSKFEHIGALTFDIEKNDKTYSVIERNSIIMSVTHILFGLENLIINLPENEDFVNRFKKLNKNLDSLASFK